MLDKKVSLYQVVYAIGLFTFGSSVAMGLVGPEVAQDTWIAILIAGAASALLYLLYARIMKCMPEKNLYEIMETVLGKFVGKAFTVLIVWYSIHLGALVLRNFSEFLQISALPETPQLATMIFMLVATVYLARSGMRVIGKYSVVVIVLVSLVVVFTVGAIVTKLRIDDLRPVLEYPYKNILLQSWKLFSFPFGEVVLFLCVADDFFKEDSPYKMLYFSLIYAVILFLFIFLRNLTLLGKEYGSITNFPSYVAVRIISVGDFLSRIEGSITSNFILSGIVKISICLLAASKGISRLFGFPKKEKELVLPIGLLVVALCAILYENTMQMFDFLNYYHYYAVPFEIIIPLITWGALEVYRKKKAKRGEPLLDRGQLLQQER